MDNWFLAAPLLVNTSLICLLVGIRIISISFFLCIWHKACNSTLRRLLLISLVLWMQSKRLSLPVITVLLVLCCWKIWLTICVMKKDISHPSVIDKVSAAKLDQTTRLIFNEFHANGQLEFLLSVINNNCPPWLPPLGRLLKLPSVHILILGESIMRLGNLMYDFRTWCAWRLYFAWWY